MLSNLRLREEVEQLQRQADEIVSQQMKQFGQRQMDGQAQRHKETIRLLTDIREVLSYIATTTPASQSGEQTNGQ